MAKNEKDGGAAAGRAGRRVGEGAANAFSFEQFIYLFKIEFKINL
jgi:hypothetical protein